MSAPMDMSKVFVREIDTESNKVLKINQLGVGDVGCVVWDAALVLAKYLESPDFNNGLNLDGKFVLELGAGTGAVGIMAGCYGANVVVTDLADFFPLLELNINTNKHLFDGKVKAAVLKWGVDGDLQQDFFNMFNNGSSQGFDIILVADCIYYEESLEPLVYTLEKLCGPHTCVYCCYEERTTGNKPELQRKFFELIQAKFSISEIPLERHDAHFRSEDIHILLFKLLDK